MQNKHTEKIQKTLAYIKDKLKKLRETYRNLKSI